MAPNPWIPPIENLKSILVVLVLLSYSDQFQCLRAPSSINLGGSKCLVNQLMRHGGQYNTVLINCVANQPFVLKINQNDGTLLNFLVNYYWININS